MGIEINSEDLEEEYIKENIDTGKNGENLESNKQRVIIKELRIQNFLSFDYDVVKFDPEFTICTGPNGSGKSTIFQALKFVLGSNNYDNRYSKWSDFIRTGEDFTNVQIFITFENKLYGIQRSIKNKESPSFYFKDHSVDKFTKTTKDKITSFVDRMNINPDNIFSFMSQGNIDRLKDFDEQTLCNFIEKGIGLEGLREDIISQKRKIEELHKQNSILILKKENLEYQLVKLKPKLRKLEKKIELESERENLENELLWAQRVEIKTKITEYQLKIDENIVKIEVYEEKIKDNTSKLQEIKNNAQKFEDELLEEIKEKTQKKERKNLIENDVNNWTTNIKKIKSELEHLDNKKFDKSQETDKFNIQFTSINQKHMDITKKIKTIEKDKKSIQLEYQELFEEFQSNQEKLVEFNSINDNINNLKQNILRLENKNQELNKSIQEKVDDIAKINHDLKKFDWFMGKEGRKKNDIHERMKKAHALYEKNVASLSQDLQDLQTQHQVFRKKIENISKSLYDKDLPKPDSIQYLMNLIRERNIKCIGPLIDYISFDSMFQMAVKSVFGYRILYSFITKSDEDFHRLKKAAEDARAKVNLYKERQKEIRENPSIKQRGENGIFGYLTNLVKPSYNIAESSYHMNAITKIIYTVARNTLVVKDHIVGTNFINQNNWQSWLVTLDGEQIRPKEYVVEARPYIKERNEYNFSDVNQAKEELNRIQSLAEKNRENYKDREDKKFDYQNKLNILKERLQVIPSLLAQYKRMEIHVNYKEKSMKERTTNYKEIEKYKKSISDKSKIMDLLLKELPKDSEIKQNRLKEIPEITKGFENELIQYRNTQSNLQEQVSDIKQKISGLEVEISYITKEIEKLTKKLDEEDDKYVQMINENMKLTEEIQTLKSSISLKKEEISTIKEGITDLENNIYEIKTQINKLNSENNIHISYVKEKEIKLEEISKLLDEFNKKIKKDNKVQSHPHHPQVPFKPERSIELIKRDIKEKDKELRRYIDVDTSLYEEKNTLKEKITEISQYKERIEREIEAAKNTQSTFEKTYYTKFKKSLHEIQQNINLKFKVAKLGFNSKIKLNGDIETLGIEINTTLPLDSEGKIYKLSALSGGQQSMVGICLILALNNLKATTFNIFDEVAHFLDPSNSQMIARLINDLAKQGIQFVMLVPGNLRSLLKYANRVIGISRNGRNGASTIHYSKPILKT